MPDAPAQPHQGVVDLRLTPSRYRDVQIICRVQGDRILPVSDTPLSTPRRPEEWLPLFSSWVALPSEFATLQEKLEQFQQFRLGRTGEPGRLIGERHDAVEPDDESPALAKICLLNLYSRLNREAAPATGAT